jgi:ATP-dependent 26S proteasome regulatory subunit
VHSDLFTKPIRSGHTCLRVVTWEEAEARNALFATSAQLDLELWTWSAARGLSRGPLATHLIDDTTNPAAAMVYLHDNLLNPSLVVLLDLAHHLGDPRILRAFRELAERFRMGTPHASAIVLLDHRDDVPSIVELLSHRVHVPLPTDEQIETLVRSTIKGLHTASPISVSITKRDLSDLVHHLRGLSRRHIEDLIRHAAVEDRAFTAEDLARIVHAKRDRVRSGGVLEFIDAPTSLDQIGGLTRLKKWLSSRQNSFSQEARDFGLVPPRGVLLLGVQGAGKSLAAKAIATAWRRPLMRLDPGALYDRYIGESERRLRDALSQAEAMAPAVLWIDEIEKGFASAASRSADGGLSQRMFGTLLTWMQEHKSPLFLVATANDIEALPPELLRKGRFDEIFFVDLPGDEARRQILSIHLKRRSTDPASVDLPALVGATRGYSGAEIEQAIIAALHEAFSTRQKLTTELLLRCIQESPPLSVTMAERVAELRQWAQRRCVPAD